MAEDAVDAAIKTGKLNPANECITQKLHVGGDGWDPASFSALAQQYVWMKKSYGGKVVPGAMDTAVAKHLSGSYGTLAERVTTIAQVNAHVKAVITLCKRKASDPKESDVLVKKWVNQLLVNASEILDLYMSKEEKSKRDISFLTPLSSRSWKIKKATSSISKLLLKATIAVYTIGSLVIVCHQ